MLLKILSTSNNVSVTEFSSSWSMSYSSRETVKRLHCWSSSIIPRKSVCLSLFLSVWVLSHDEIQIKNLWVASVFSFLRFLITFSVVFSVSTFLTYYPCWKFHLNYAYYSTISDSSSLPKYFAGSSEHLEIVGWIKWGKANFCHINHPLIQTVLVLQIHLPDIIQ